MTLIDKAAMMTERYEHMRAMRHLHRQRTQEMELMIGSGMLGWMQAWAQHASPVAPADLRVPCCDINASAEPLSISDIAHGEAVGILTSMVWDIVKEDVHAYAG